MSTTELPFRATAGQACDWLAGQTGTPWTLARMLEAGLTPYVWLDYDAAHADLFGDANGGYAAPVFYEGDIARLAAGSEDVLITMTKDVYRLPARLPAPGLRRALHELRFLKKDVERLPARLAREAAPAPPAPAAQAAPGIDKGQVLAAFGALVRIDLDAALAGAGGMFGDDGSRIKGSARKSRHQALWHPVTLALGLNDVYRVPVARLTKAFASHAFLAPWRADWERSLQLLGK